MADQPINTDSLPPFVIEFFDMMRTHFLPRIENATVPVLGVQNDRIVHDRTGVLYRIGDRRFLLTAAHHLRGIVQHQIPLYISLNTAEKIPLPLAEASFHTTEEDGRDVAAISLPTDVALQIEAHRTFVRHNEISLHDESPPGFYLFFGYPMEWSGIVLSETDVYSRALAFGCREYTGTPHPTVFYDKAVHIQLEFHRKAVNVTQNTTEILPRINGISGCGIWRVADWSPEGIQNWSQEVPRLVGIQNHWFLDRKYIQGTRVGFVLSLILANYPDVKRAMDLVYPRK